MLHSKVTSKGQTTIPGKIRRALRIKPGDKLEYVVEGDHVAIRVHPGTGIKGCARAYFVSPKGAVDSLQHRSVSGTQGIPWRNSREEKATANREICRRASRLDLPNHG